MLLKLLMQNLKYILLLAAIFILSCSLSAQNTVLKENSGIVHRHVQDEDTLLSGEIEEVIIFPKRKFKNAWQAWRYRRLIYNTKKAYPYAVLANEMLKEINDHLATIENERERKKYIEKAEKELKDQFEDELKKLTITQGRILIKLIDRETGNTSYELVKELRGSFSAFLWQTVAKLFGSDLKSEFDADGEDKLLNEIVMRIEAGQL